MARDTLHPRLVPAVAAGAIAVFLLSGCTTPDPAPAPSSAAPTTAPVFASDEEALAAAKSAYGEYLRIADEVFADGGREPDRFKSVASGQALSSLEADATEFQEKRVRSVGTTSFDNLTLQSVTVNEVGNTIARIYVCEDVSDIDVLDKAGKSLVASDRQARQGFEVGILASVDVSALTVATREPWNGAGVCS